MKKRIGAKIKQREKELAYNNHLENIFMSSPLLWLKMHLLLQHLNSGNKDKDLCNVF